MVGFDFFSIGFGWLRGSDWIVMEKVFKSLGGSLRGKNGEI